MKHKKRNLTAKLKNIVRPSYDLLLMEIDEKQTSLQLHIEQKENLMSVSEAYDFVSDNSEWFRKEFSKKDQMALLELFQHPPEEIENISASKNIIEDIAGSPATFPHSRKNSASLFEQVKKLSEDAKVEKKESKQTQYLLSGTDIDTISLIITEITTELNSIKRDYEKPFFKKTAEKKSCVDLCIDLLKEIQVALDNDENKAISSIKSLIELINKLTVLSQEKRIDNCLSRFFSSQRGQTKNEQNSFVKIKENVNKLEFILSDENKIVKNFEWAKNQIISSIIKDIRNRANQYIKNFFRYEKTKDKLIPMKKLMDTAKAINKFLRDKDWLSISAEDNKQLAVFLAQLQLDFTEFQKVVYADRSNCGGLFSLNVESLRGQTGGEKIFIQKMSEDIKSLQTNLGYDIAEYTESQYLRQLKRF